MTVSLVIAPRGIFKCTITTLGAASLHCVARRYQRGRTNDDGAVFADLAALADAYDEAAVPATSSAAKAGRGEAQPWRSRTAT